MVMLRDVAKLTPRWNTESAERDNMVGNNKTNENQIRTLIEKTGQKLSMREASMTCWLITPIMGVANATEFTIGHNVRSKEEVDIVMEQAKNAGARITNPAQDRFWGGYSGYFQDPDGHLWEVVWNPQMEIAE